MWVPQLHIQKQKAVVQETFELAHRLKAQEISQLEVLQRAYMGCAKGAALAGYSSQLTRIPKDSEEELREARVGAHDSHGDGYGASGPSRFAGPPRTQP